tara:strand:+ start:1122 stop:1643 length:522 start_codon:yes stop_codon:yes gene_type:complete
MSKKFKHSNPLKPETVSIGIDNGTTGAAVAVDVGGSILGKIKMPLSEVGGSTCPDTTTLLEWAGSWEGAHITLEEAPKHAPSATSLRSQAIGFGMIYDAFNRHPNFTIDLIHPRTWQTDTLGKVPKGRTKEFALVKANDMCEGEDWLATARSKKPHDGIVDAYLIACWRRDLV